MSRDGEVPVVDFLWSASVLWSFFIPCIDTVGMIENASGL